MKRSLAKEKAARDEVNPPTSSTGTATVRLFRIPLRKRPLWSTSEYMPPFQGLGMMEKSAERIWFFVMKEHMIM